MPVLDLTRVLGPRSPLWPGVEPMREQTVATVARDGYYARRLELHEHSGTHLDAPAHFASGGACVHEIPAERLVRPAAVLDVRPLIGGDAQFALGVEQIEDLERRDGPIPQGAAVLVCTGWGDEASAPGVSPAAGRFLLEQRAIAGLGIDNLSVDAGLSTDLHELTLPAGIWHLELLTGLEQLPPRGATLVVGVPRVLEASGAPARVLALLP
jgi:kynurenine formamidase